jgi:hypothetical protein
MGEAAKRDLSPFPESAFITGRTTVANGAWDPPSGASIGEAVASEPYKARMKSS